MYRIEVDTQEQADKKQQELEAKIAAYKAAQQRQIEQGGPGPVASFEVLAIVNQHNSEFEIVIKE